MQLPVRTVAPASALLTVAEVKAQARIETDDEDGLLALLIAAAEGMLDGTGGILGRALVTQTWAVSLPAFQETIRLPLAPVQSATVGYVDPDGATQTLADAYRLHADEVSPYLKQLPDVALPAVAERDDAVTVTAVCGYGAPGAVPADIRQAALMIVAHMYENREATSSMSFTELPLGPQWILAKHRRCLA